MSSFFQILKDGGAAVIPTDTLYGLVCSALNEAAVERIYTLRKRDQDKPCIILIGSIKDIEQFGIILTTELIRKLEKFWPGPVSILLKVGDSKWNYLTRGGDTLAFRLPDDASLASLLTQTGPLLAPSANTQGNPPAQTIAEAKVYFGDSVDWYEDGGVLDGEPSALIAFERGEVRVIRARKNGLL